MAIGLTQWRAGIGNFNATSLIVRYRTVSFFELFLPILQFISTFFLFALIFPAGLAIAIFKVSVFSYFPCLSHCNIDGLALSTRLYLGVKTLPYSFVMLFVQLSKRICCLLRFALANKHVDIKIVTVLWIFSLEFYCNNLLTVQRLALLMSGNVHPNPGPFTSSFVTRI